MNRVFEIIQISEDSILLKDFLPFCHKLSKVIDKLKLPLIMQIQDLKSWDVIKSNFSNST
jgi:hypothetical protein